MRVQRCGIALPLAFHFGVHVNWSHRSHWTPEMCFVVSGLFSSKASVYSLKMKEFCRGKAGWNDSAIFIETDLKPVSEPVQPHSVFSNPDKVLPNALPSALPEILSLRS